ncbi:MAG TPA: methyltransferase domain-containing protein [Chloroflexia bacterium]|nr:methyltransferase domain-containing protein [Chloroflexia bacterium]
MAPTQPFDANASTFNDYLNAPWGRLLHNISQANLQRHLDEHRGRPLRILDAGGGSGTDAISFAAQGHAVAILDPSARLLDEARHNAQVVGLAEHIEFYEAELAAIPKLFPEVIFDVVLCHNVLQYVEDMGAALEAICHPLLPGGLVSAICINRYSEAYRAALQQLEPGAAYEKLDTKTTFSSVFKLPVRAYAAEDAIQALQEAGCALLAHYGVRCVYDYIPNSDIKDEPAFFAELERLEYAMSDKYPYYLLARFFQIVARKG